MPDSVRARLTLWYAGTLAVGLIAAFTVGYVLFSRSLHRRLDQSLRSSAAALSALMADELLEGESPPRGRPRARCGSPALPDRAVTVLDGNGAVLASREGTRGAPRATIAARWRGGGVLRFTTEDAGDVARLVQEGVAHDGQRYTVVVALSLEPLREDLALFRRAAFLAVPAAVLLAALGGWILTGRTLAPVVLMCAEARQIGDSDLDRRLPVLNPRDELGTLAATFNDLIARLQASLTRQRGFVADASHELRTPLSIVRSAATLTLDRPAPRGARVPLRAAGGGRREPPAEPAGGRHAHPGPGGCRPLPACARPACAWPRCWRTWPARGRCWARARSLRVSFAFAGEAAFRGDEDLLRRMMLNLVENAQAHSPDGLDRRPRAGARVTASGASACATRVRAFRPAEQSRVFDRFYRGEGSAPGGAGLGLAIARWIAEAHRGALRIEDSAPGGTTLLVSLPAQEAATLAS